MSVVLFDILAANGNKCVNLLLDSEAQSSLIRLSSAVEIELKGKAVNCNLWGIRWRRRTIKNKTVRIRVRSLQRNSAHTVTTDEIPCIREDISEIKLRDVVKQFGLSEARFYRGVGPVNILIVLHTEETKKVHNLLARNSPLMWVILQTML